MFTAMRRGVCNAPHMHDFVMWEEVRVQRKILTSMDSTRKLITAEI